MILSSRRDERKLNFTIMLNILLCLLGYVKMDDRNVSSLIISRGCSLHHSLRTTYVTITWSKGKSIYFLLNYIYIIQVFFPSNYWKDACLIILLKKKLIYKLRYSDGRECSGVKLVLTVRFIFSLKFVCFFTFISMEISMPILVYC